MGCVGDSRMSELNFNGKSVQVGNVKQFPIATDGGLPYGRQAGDALIPNANDTQLKDGLILSDGAHHHVVVQRGLNANLREGSKVTLDGKEMTVLRSLNAPDTLREKINYWTGMIPIMFRSAVSQAMGRGNGFG